MRVVQIEPGPTPTLTALTPASISAFVASAGRDVAGDELELRELLARLAHRLEHAGRVTVRGVDADDVAARGDQRLDARVAIGADADRRADAETAALVVRGESGSPAPARCRGS